jgi:hypothetical protein
LEQQHDKKKWPSEIQLNLSTSNVNALFYKRMGAVVDFTGGLGSGYAGLHLDHHGHEF